MEVLIRQSALQTIDEKQNEPNQTKRNIFRLKNEQEQETE